MLTVIHISEKRAYFKCAAALNHVWIKLLFATVAKIN